MINLVFVLDLFHVIKFLAQHLCHQFDPGKIFNHVLAHQLSVAENRNLVTHLVDLIQKVGNKDNPHAPAAQIAHQAKKLFHLVIIQ